MTRQNPLDRARAAFRGKRWREAYRHFADAEALAPLGADDAWSFAWAAQLSGRGEAFLRILERLHDAHLSRGDHAGAARCAIWMGLHLGNSGEPGRASGWMGRARRLLDRHGHDCVERGYLRLAAARHSLGAGDLEGALAAAGDALAAGDRYADADLQAFALHAQGIAHLRHGQLEEGLALLDEAMVAVERDELSPTVTGILYCSMIAACSHAYAWQRARAWTSALERWCDGQPELVPFGGACLVFRAEVLQRGGAWSEALTAVELARRRSAAAHDPEAEARAWYQRGEIHRRGGALHLAEEAYAAAAAMGRDPQPGLALLRLAQGRGTVAFAALRRALEESRDPGGRVLLLPAVIEVALALEDLESARRACDELRRRAETYGASVLRHVVAQWRGALALREGDAAGSLVHLRDAWRGWVALGAPYEAARVRELVGRACEALGDHDTASVELQAATEAYRSLDARLDLARLERGMAAHAAHGLTARELEVLRWVATGGSNKDVAARLAISERTVERHLSNIFTKLGVASRAAATAYAYQHRLT